MQTYQNLTDHELTIPNVGLVPPHGTVETDLELNNPSLQPITNHPPAAPVPHIPEPQPIQAAPEPNTTEEH